MASCFHSINVPSEWGLAAILLQNPENEVVSIQLMSPASGDFTLYQNLEPQLLIYVSIQLMSPASGDQLHRIHASHQRIVSIQLMSPASGDCRILTYDRYK